jgi:hypothetical protein
MNIFDGRCVLIATKHQKETVIAPLLKQELKLNSFTPDQFDTDRYGTFCGTTVRKDDPVTTLRKKCTDAMEQYGYDLALASEGSFGSHPSIPFVAADDECMMLIDRKNNLEIVARELSTDTNLRSEMVYDRNQLRKFIDQSLFPTHGLMISRSADDRSEMYKGICTIDSLYSTFDHFIEKYGQAYIETDMRAMYNPTRMKVIEAATKKLIAKMRSYCPECGTCGFDIRETRTGLPCEYCNLPTTSLLSHIYVCQQCSYKREVMYPYQKTYENPMYCDYCNP